VPVTAKTGGVPDINCPRQVCSSELGANSESQQSQRLQQEDSSSRTSLVRNADQTFVAPARKSKLLEIVPRAVVNRMDVHPKDRSL
jgi:hypothetical protein